jgi:hypothetical protein
MAKPNPPPDEDFTAELTAYVTPTMREQVGQVAKEKGVSISIVVRWALTSWLKEQKR